MLIPSYCSSSGSSGSSNNMVQHHPPQTSIIGISSSVMSASSHHWPKVVMTGLDCGKIVTVESANNNSNHHHNHHNTFHPSSEPSPLSRSVSNSSTVSTTNGSSISTGYNSVESHSPTASAVAEAVIREVLNVVSDDDDDDDDDNNHSSTDGEGSQPRGHYIASMTNGNCGNQVDDDMDLDIDLVLGLRRIGVGGNGGTDNATGSEGGGLGRANSSSAPPVLDPGFNSFNSSIIGVSPHIQQQQHIQQHGRHHLNHNHNHHQRQSSILGSAVSNSSHIIHQRHLSSASSSSTSSSISISNGHMRNLSKIINPAANSLLSDILSINNSPTIGSGLISSNSNSSSSFSDLVSPLSSALPALPPLHMSFNSSIPTGSQALGSAWIPPLSSSTSNTGMDSLLTSGGGHIMHTGSRSNSTGGIIGMSSSISNDGVGTINGPARSSSCHGAIGDLTASNLAPLSIPSSTPGVFQHCSLSLFHGTQLPSSTASPASPSILSPHIGLGDTSNISLLSRRRSNRPDEGFVAPDLSLAMNTLPPLPPLPSLPTMPLGQQYQQPSGVAPTSATLDLLGGAGKILQLPSPSLHQYQQPTPTSGTLPPPLAKFSYPSPAGMTYQHRHRLGSRASADSLSQLSRELDISRVQNGTINNYHINNTTNQLAELVQKQPVASTMASGLSTPVLSNRSSVHSVRDTEADSLSTNNNNKVDLQADRTSSNTSDNSSASTSNTPPSLVSDSDIAGNASDHQQQQPAVEDSAIAKLHSMIATLKSMKKVPLSATNGTFSPSTAATDEIAATYTSNANMDNSNNNNSSTNSNGPIISTSVSSSSNTGSNQQRKRPTHARSRSVALSPTTFASLVPASSIPNTPKATPTHFPPHHHYGQGPHQRPPIHPLGNHHSRPANNGSHTPGLSSYGSRSHLRQSSHAPSLMSTTQHHQQLAQVLDSNKSRNRSSTTSLRAQLDMPWRDGATTATSAVAAS